MLEIENSIENVKKKEIKMLIQMTIGNRGVGNREFNRKYSIEKKGIEVLM